MHRLLLPCTLVITLALAPGCVAVVAGAAAAGTMSYVTNETARSYPATVEATWSAAFEALRDVGYPVDASMTYGADKDEFEIEDVKVQVKSDGVKSTRVWVRVGTFDNEGNREKAQRILDAISKRIGA